MTTERATSEADVAAAELALGVLDGEERAAALRRVLAEPDFARAVERWRAHFGLMFDGVKEVAPPGELFNRIEARIDSPKRAVNPWKPTAIAASVAALAMTAVALRPVEAPLAPAPPPQIVAAAPMVAAMVLTENGGSQPAIYDAATGVVKMAGPMPIPAGKSAQLWAIEGQAPPKPLGTFHSSESGILEAEAKSGALIGPGTTLAISIEPVGGSPTGAPTGPVIATGALTKV